DQMCETIAQGGARRGAQMGVMRVSHPDVIQFIHAKNKDVSLAHTLRLNDPDDYTHNSFTEALEEARELIDDEGRVPKHLRNAVEGHLSNFNISVGITDRFMEAVKEGEEYTFTNPRNGEPHVATEETRELYEMFDLGEYVEVGEELSVPAELVWERIVEGAHENGEPGVIYLERVNKKHSFDVEEHPEHRILATNPSLAAGTKVLTDQGIVPIEQLEGSRVEVPTLGGEWADAICRRSGNDEPLYEIELSNGKTYLATEEHKWPIRQEDGSYERTKTTDIESGSRLPFEHRESLRYGSVGDYDEGFLVGWLYGDGNVTHRKDGRTQYGLLFSQEDADNGVMDRVLNTLEGITGVEYTPTERQRDGEPWYEVHASHAALRRQMGEYGVDKKAKGLPDIVWSDASESFRKGLVDGLFSADGYVDSEQNRIILVSSKEELVTDVSDLLGFYGLKTSLNNSETEKWDDTYDRWDLKLSRIAAHRFRETFDLSHETKATALADLKTPDRDNLLSDHVTVEAVREADESGPVWDLRVGEETHTFALSHVFTGNCGEQPLEEYEACNLGHINLSTLAAEDATDWRVWSERHADEYDTQEAAIEAFMEGAIDWEEFDRRIELGTRFLENVVTMSDFPVDEIERKVREMRKIGLGIMGLAQLNIQLGMKYGSDSANELARQLMTHINHHSKWTSHELATERGSFSEWDKSKYADPTAYPEWFEHHTGLDPEEYADGFPIRNHNTTTIAPTGTTSMVGNTTGGCEPIYNVAYYKNVSDDVQGDEMLVEFDDYFLRVLEANDIDVAAVKEEAQEQMANNEFDGIDGLTTVPDAIGELFVTTGDLSAKEHAGVQTACQEGVDSAISKTVNAPTDSTVADAKDVFEYIYDHGGKGVTYYRDGTRSKQVLTTRAKNTEFADESEAAEALVEQIEEVFGGIEAFVESEEVQAVVDHQVEELLSAVDGDREEFAHKRDRPDVLQGVTQRIDTGYGKLYVNINEDPEADRPFELFANIGNSGGFTASFTEALAKTISTALRAGVDPQEIAEELQGIRSPKVAWDKGEQIQSIPDAIGTAMRRYLEGDVERAYPQQQTLEETAEEADESGADGQADLGTSGPEPDGGVSAETATGDQQALIDAGESPECPECGSLSLYYSEGCKTCESCGWSEC
ncbi:MAG: ribonucleoside-diphosphate reductase alpha chain, partial [Haloarculaceae archaeon]